MSYKCVNKCITHIKDRYSVNLWITLLKTFSLRVTLIQMVLVSHKDSQDNAHSRNVKWRHVYLVKNYGEAGSYCCVSRFEISEVKIRGSDQGLGPIPA